MPAASRGRPSQLCARVRKLRDCEVTKRSNIRFIVDVDSFVTHVATAGLAGSAAAWHACALASLQRHVNPTCHTRLRLSKAEELLRNFHSYASPSVRGLWMVFWVDC